MPPVSYYSLTSDYYYRTRSSDTSDSAWTWAPIGRPKTIRLIQSKAPYRRQELEKPKDIILNDEFLSAFSAAKRAKLNDFIRALQAEGRRVFCSRRLKEPEESELVLVRDADELYLNLDESDGSRLSAPAIERAMVPLNLSADKCITLDHFEIERQLYQHQPGVKIYRLSEWRKRGRYLSQLINRYAKDNVTILIDCFTEEISALWQRLQAPGQGAERELEADPTLQRLAEGLKKGNIQIDIETMILFGANLTCESLSAFFERYPPQCYELDLSRFESCHQLHPSLMSVIAQVYRLNLFGASYEFELTISIDQDRGDSPIPSLQGLQESHERLEQPSVTDGLDPLDSLLSIPLTRQHSLDRAPYKTATTIDFSDTDSISYISADSQEGQCFIAFWTLLNAATALKDLCLCSQSLQQLWDGYSAISIAPDEQEKTSLAFLRPIISKLDIFTLHGVSLNPEALSHCTHLKRLECHHTPFFIEERLDDFRALEVLVIDAPKVTTVTQGHTALASMLQAACQSPFLTSLQLQQIQHSRTNPVIRMGEMRIGGEEIPTATLDEITLIKTILTAKQLSNIILADVHLIQALSVSDMEAFFDIKDKRRINMLTLTSGTTITLSALLILLNQFSYIGHLNLSRVNIVNDFGESGLDARDYIVLSDLEVGILDCQHAQIPQGCGLLSMLGQSVTVTKALYVESIQSASKEELLALADIQLGHIQKGDVGLTQDISYKTMNVIRHSWQFKLFKKTFYYHHPVKLELNFPLSEADVLGVYPHLSDLDVFMGLPDNFRYLAKLMGACPKLDTLTLYLPHAWSQQEQTQCPTMRQLRSLTLYLEPSETIPGLPLIMLARCPELFFLSLSHFSFDPEDPILQAPLPIEELDIAKGATAQCISVEQVSNMIIHLPHVNSLCINHNPCFFDGFLLSDNTFKDLSYLTIKNDALACLQQQSYQTRLAEKYPDIDTLSLVIDNQGGSIPLTFTQAFIEYLINIPNLTIDVFSHSHKFTATLQYIQHQRHRQRHPSEQTVIKVRAELPQVSATDSATRASTKDTSPRTRSSTTYRSKKPTPQTAMLTRPEKAVNINVNTAPLRQTFTPQTYFQALRGAPVAKHNLYRLNVYSKLVVSEDSSHQPFTLITADFEPLTQASDIHFISGDSPPLTEEVLSGIGDFDEDRHLYLGRIFLNYQNGDWIPLPSLSTQESISLVQCLGGNDHIEIKYSKKTNCYYARVIQPISQPLEVRYVVEVPSHARVISMEPQTPLAEDSRALLESIHPDLVALFIRYNNFGAKALTDKDGIELSSEELDALSGIKILALINAQEVGSCRHRAVAFMHELNQRDIPARIIHNGCHAYCEVWNETARQWHQLDLGGYPSNITPQPMFKEKEATRTEPSTLRLVESSPLVSDQIPWINSLWTFQAEESEPLSTLDYIQGIQHDHFDKRLLNFSDARALKTFQYHLQKKMQHRCFYINSTEDLTVSLPFLVDVLDMEDIDVEQQIRALSYQKEASPLLQFFRRIKHSGVILINYANFRPQDIIRFNTLLDRLRRIDGIDVPAHIKVVGMHIPTSKSAYIRGDFLSRFSEDNIIDIPHSASEMNEDMADQPPKLKAIALDVPIGAEVEERVIDFYHSEDWQSALYHIALTDGQVSYQKGPLFDALTSDTPLNIRLVNAPWHDASFRHFIEQVLFTRTINLFGVRHRIKDSIHLVQSEDLSLDCRCLDALPEPSEAEPFYLLNPSRFADMFAMYDIQGEFLSSGAGLLAKAKEAGLACLHLHLSADISRDNWRELLAKAQDLGLKLRLTRSASVAEVDGINIPIEDVPAMPNSPDLVVQATDVSFAAASYHHVIDVSDFNEGDLFKTFIPSDPKNPLKITERLGAILHLLNQGETVTLKGRFSASMMDSINQLLLERGRAADPPGKLVIICEDAQPFVAPRIIEEDCDEATQLDALMTWYDYSVDEISNAAALLERHTIPWSWQTILCLLKRRRQLDEPDYDPWHEMYQPPLKLPPGHDLTDATRCQAFIHGRMQKIQSVLKNSPFVYIMGVTGVGKTGFMRHHLRQEPDTETIFYGEADLRAWAAQAPPEGQYRYIFIDEANIGNKASLCFSTLKNTPPAIIIDGEYIELSPNHKVIFASNPLSYGDERSQMPLLKHLPEVVSFGPMSKPYLFQTILDPLFDIEDIPESYRIRVANVVLDMYEWLVAISHQDITITPRELQAAILLALANSNSLESLEASCRFYSYHLCHRFVPKSARGRFDKQFAPKEPLSPQEVSAKLLNDYLMLSQKRHGHWHKKQQALSASGKHAKAKRLENCLYAGLNALNFEGHSGIGKSTMIASELERLHYVDKQDASSESALVYYRIQASLSVEEKQTLLLQAFMEGAPVIMDEINSSVSMERFLNALLNGQHPTELTRSPKPGFFIIASQNPQHYGGRTKMSPALEHRQTLLDYTLMSKEALLEELDGLYKIKFELICRIVDRFYQQRDIAIAQHIKPIPNLRDLFDKLDKLDRRLHPQVPHPFKIRDIIEVLEQALQLFETSSQPQDKQHVEEPRTPVPSVLTQTLTISAPQESHVVQIETLLVRLQQKQITRAPLAREALEDLLAHLKEIDEPAHDELLHLIQRHQAELVRPTH